ncbi:MAG: hypothetical protein MZU91_01710 [Desulfosudis oleivorans]|nr:hypothetical protein [Desulfosudis oleivorans]
MPRSPRSCCAEITWIPARRDRGGGRRLRQHKTRQHRPRHGRRVPGQRRLRPHQGAHHPVRHHRQPGGKGGNLNCVPPTKKRSCYGPDYSAYNNLPQGAGGQEAGARPLPAYRPHTHTQPAPGCLARHRDGQALPGEGCRPVRQQQRVRLP